MKLTFTGTKPFEANNAAERWCELRGVEYGGMERDQPRGLMVGTGHIPKWTHMTASERKELHGTMTGNMRLGPVTIELRDDIALRLPTYPDTTTP